MQNERRKRQTGACDIDLYISGLSVVDKILKSEESTTKNNGTTRIENGYSSVMSQKSKSPLARNLLISGIIGSVIFTAGCAAVNTFDNGLDSSLIAVDADDNPIIPKDDMFYLLLNKSESEKQREVLGSVGNFLADYNIRFAHPIEDTVTLQHSETKEMKTLTVRPALSWDEVMSMTLVYNNFSKDDLIEILNGGEIDSYELNNAYKVATLQLMGAHVLETRENPVNIDMILHTKEAKDFYEKYHKMFLKAKETTEEERLAAVKAFYDELYKDFPITAEVRQEGISHGDPRADIEPYKFSIIPMVAASEIMFQNLEVDHTLTQEAIDYLNDIGGCNIAEDILDKAELIALTTTRNDKYADYGKVRLAAISFLKEENAYVIDDDHRELSYLPAFQEIVNGFLLQPYTYTITTSWSVTDYYTVTDETRTDDRDKAVELAGEDAVKDAEEKAQDELDRENEEARQEAEKEADEAAKDMQEEEDQKREDLEEEVEQDDQDYQNNIDDANENQNNGDNVNEDDLGHGTDFDDEHSNSDGDLDDSIRDVTTDGDGAHDSSDPLPDPNADSYSAQSSDYSSASVQSTTSAQSEVAAASESTSNDTYEDPTYEEPVYEYEEPYTFTSEEEIDLYIESLAAQPSVYEDTSYGHRL